jgi:ribosome-binding factor A
MASPTRQKRVADRLQEEISALLQREIKDPRLTLVTVTRVNIDRELAYASVFVSAVADETRRKEILRVLEGARGFIRREIGQRVRLRQTPHIVFHWDPGPDNVEQVGRLLDELRAANLPAEAKAESPRLEEDRRDDER